MQNWLPRKGPSGHLEPWLVLNASFLPHARGGYGKVFEVSEPLTLRAPGEPS